MQADFVSSLFGFGYYTRLQYNMIEFPAKECKINGFRLGWVRSRRLNKENGDFSNFYFFHAYTAREYSKVDQNLLHMRQCIYLFFYESPYSSWKKQENIILLFSKWVLYSYLCAFWTCSGRQFDKLVFLYKSILKCFCGLLSKCLRLTIVAVRRTFETTLRYGLLLLAWMNEILVCFVVCRCNAKYILYAIRVINMDSAFYIIFQFSLWFPV